MAVPRRQLPSSRPKKPASNPPSDVRLHPEAERELAAIKDADERVAIMHAEEKLRTLGRLMAPHSSALQGSGKGLRELRPRGGRSPWRPIYRQIGETFVVLAVAPEAGVDKTGFDRAVTHALQRLAELEN